MFRHETCLNPARCPASPGALNLCVGEPVKGRLRSWPLRGFWPRSEARPASADATADSRRPDGSRPARNGDLLARLALITALSITILSAAGGILLMQQTAAHRRALLLMSQVEERIGQEHVIKRQAILEPRRGQELVARLRESRQQLTSSSPARGATARA